MCKPDEASNEGFTKMVNILDKHRSFAQAILHPKWQNLHCFMCIHHTGIMKGVKNIRRIRKTDFSYRYENVKAMFGLQFAIKTERS